MARGVATRGQSKLSGESKAKAPERGVRQRGARHSGAVCRVYLQYHVSRAITCKFVVVVYNHTVVGLCD